MNTEQEYKELVAGIIEWLDIHDDNKLVALAEKFRPKPKRVGYLKWDRDHTSVVYERKAVELDDEVRTRLGQTAGVRATKVLSIIEHIGISNEKKAARIMDLIESASVEVEDELR